MDDVTTPTGDRCLICLIQASGSMRDTIYSGAVPTKIAAALRIVDWLIDDLFQFAAEQPAGSPRIEVGVLAYSTRSDGRLRLRQLLRGPASREPLMPLSALARPVPSADGDGGRGPWVEAEPSGEALAHAALYYTRGLLARRAVEDPGAAPPVVVHCTDGETSDGPIGGDVMALTDAVPGAIIVHCLFRRGVASSAFTPAPETPCGDLWAMSSLYSGEAPTASGAPAQRLLFVNKVSVARTIGQMIRRLWSRAPRPVAEAHPAEAVEEASEPVSGPAPEPVPEPEPSLPPRFEARALMMPKRGNGEKEWEDGYATNPAEGVLAVGDGAGDGIFSKLWVDLLLESFLERPIPLDDLSAVEPWIQERRRAWIQAIRYPEQRWSIQRKIDQSCGAATFLGFRLDAPPAEGAAPDPATGWTAWAVGDTCLFQIRAGRLIAAFPIGASAEFNITPDLYQSKAMRPTPRAVVMRGQLQAGDQIVCATDALAQRLLAEIESGSPPDWDRFWDLDQETWRQEIEAIRDQNGIVNDDCTLVVLRLLGSMPGVSEEPGLERVEGSPDAERVEEAGAVAAEIAPTFEASDAAMEPVAEPSPADGGGPPDESGTDPGSSPTESHSSPEDSRDES